MDAKTRHRIPAKSSSGISPATSHGKHLFMEQIQAGRPVRLSGELLPRGRVTWPAQELFDGGHKPGGLIDDVEQALVREQLG
jgi:hypothetical protein